MEENTNKKYVTLFLVLFPMSSGMMHHFANHENDNDMISNYGNNSIFASNQSGYIAL